MLNSLAIPVVFFAAAEAAGAKGPPPAPSYLAVHPGVLFVIATLLPLASFVGIFIWFGIWSLARRYHDTRLGEQLYRLTGGDVPRRGPAYVATAAIDFAETRCGFSQ